MFGANRNLLLDDEELAHYLHSANRKDSNSYKKSEKKSSPEEYILVLPCIRCIQNKNVTKMFA